MSQFEPKPEPLDAEVPPRSSTLAVVSLVFGFLSFCIPLVAGFLAIVCSAIAILQISNSGGKLTGKGLAVAGLALGSAGMFVNIVLLVALLLPAVQAAREAAKRMQTSNNLKMIGIAMHNYHDTYRTLPPSGVVYEPTEDESLKPTLGLSWRVRILPFVEELELYREFDQNVPWDHPNNKRLIERMPDVFKSPNRAVDDGKTVYLGVVYPWGLDPDSLPDERFRQYLRGTAFDHGPFRPQPGMRTIRFADTTDGTSNTISVVEADADQAVIWTKPDDWKFDVENPSAGLGSLRPGGFMALFIDGSTYWISNEVDPDNLRRLFCRRDDEPIDRQFMGP
jgi:hypothetical protein